jgi:WD40 repeat protein
MKKILFLMIYVNSIMCLMAAGSGQQISDPDRFATIACSQEYIAAGKERGGINIYDATTLDYIRTFEIYDIVWQIEFSPDGKFMASSTGYEILIHEIETGNIIFTAVGRRVSYNSDGSRLVSGANGRITVWDTLSRNEILTIEGPHESVQSVSYSPDGVKILSAFESCVIVWDANNGTELIRIQENRFVRSASWNRDGTKITATYFSNDEDNFSGGLVKIYDTDSYYELNSFTRRYEEVKNSFFGHNDKYIIIVGSYTHSGPTISIIDSTTGEVISGRRHGIMTVYSQNPIGINNDSNIIYYTESGKDIRVWKIE